MRLHFDDTVERFVLHGLGVEMRLGLPGVSSALAAHLKGFSETLWPEGFTGTLGQIRPYEQHEVLRHLSSSAEHLLTTPAGIDVFSERELFWLVDDRWGIAEIDFVKGMWRSWLLPPALSDGLRSMEGAVLFPLAQLLRPKGLHLVPAVSVARGGFSTLILSPFGIEPELTAMVRAGYRVIGQRWTALRIEGNRASLLHMPSPCEKSPWPRAPQSVPQSASWIDLHASFAGSRQNHAFCDSVLLVAPGRRAQGSINGLSRWEAPQAIKNAWPIPELHPSKRPRQLAVHLGQSARCAEARFSSNGADVLQLLDALRRGDVGHGTGRVTVYINVPRPRVAI